ncbi:MAG: PKD domain-containing protein [Candidatus Woesearchaeota archaeon]
MKKAALLWIMGLIIFFALAQYALSEVSPVSISINQPVEGDSLYSSSLYVQFSINESGNYNCTLTLYCGDLGGNVSTSLILPAQNYTALSPLTVNLDAPSCSYSSNYLEVQCSDEQAYGNASTYFYIFELPSVNTYEPNDSAIINSSSFQFEYEILPESSAYLVKNCALILDGTSCNSTDLPHNGTNSISCPFSEGSHTWKVLCTLIGSGQETIESQERGFFADYSPPNINLINPNQPAYNSDVPIEFNITDSASSSFNCTISGIPAPFNLSSLVSYSSKLNLPVGKYNLTISCSDAAGNSAYTWQEFERINLSVSTDKKYYIPMENVFITLNAPPSQTNISVSKGNFTLSKTTTPPYPIVYIFTSSNEPGDYLVQAFTTYNNITFTANTSFSVNITRNLTLSISANTTTAEPGVRILFYSNVSGNLTPVTYLWDFNNDNLPESSLPNTEYSFSQPGRYLVTLKVNDSYSSASASINITVLSRANLSITVLNRLGEPLAGANITLGNTSAITNSSGAAVMQNLLQGTYPINVTATNYNSYFNTVDISSNKNITIYLQELTEEPEILITEPTDGATITSLPITIRFKANLSYPTNCTLYKNEQQSWWEQLSQMAVTNNTENTLSVANLTDGQVLLRIVCTDVFGNSGTQQISLNISTLPKEPQYPELDQAEEELYTKQEYYNSIGPAQLEAAQLLGIPDMLSDAQNRLTLARRDLSDLSYSKKSPEEKEARKSEIISDAVSRINAIPDSIQVLSSYEQIHYPTQQELEKVAAPFISANSLKIDQRTFLRANSPLIELITINTKAFSIVLNYNGESREVSVIKHSVQLSQQLNESAISNLMLILNIPKQIADSAAGITFMDRYGQKVVKDDPIFSLPVTSEIVYQINKSIDANSASEISLLLVSKSASVSIPGISGLAVSQTRYSIWPFNLIGGKIGSSLAIQIVILVVLLTIYLVYTLQPEIISRSADALGNHIKNLRPRSENRMKQIVHAEKSIPTTLQNNLASMPQQQTYSPIQQQVVPIGPGMQHSYIAYRMQRALQLAEQNNYEEASAAYYELKFLYNTLSSHEKSLLYPQLLNLGHKLNISYIRQLVSEARSKVDSDYQEALELYDKISKAYSLLPTEFKYAVFSECLELLNILERARKNQNNSENQAVTFKKKKKRCRSKSHAKARRA